MSNYDGKNIKVLKGLQAVRSRPGMYLGDSGNKGLHHCFKEILDNSVDEFLAGHCNEITVTLHSDEETMTIEDNGRGIPVEIHPEEGKSTLEVVMTVLHAGGKFDEDSYEVSGGLHGVGASCVNAVSDILTVFVKRDGFLYSQSYSKGIPSSDVKKIRPLEKNEKSGTKTTWHCDVEIFKAGVKLDFSIIESRIRELAYLNKGLKLTLINEKENSNKEFKFENGILDYVGYLSSSKSNHYPVDPHYSSSKKDKISAEISFVWTDDDSECIYSYVNNIFTSDGGPHLTGFKNALTRCINKLAQNANLLKEKDENPIGDDYREGLTAVIATRIPQPEFTSQEKTRLSTLEAESALNSITTEILTNFFERNPKILSKVVERALLSQKARNAAKKQSDIIKKKSIFAGRVVKKLSDCRNNNPVENEIFLVEGDSAGGSAKLGRNSEYQAILSCKGKILNAEKNDISDVLKNEEVLNIINSLGAGVKDTFDINKLNYHKVILMNDSDDDGKHISTLLIAFFYRYMKPLILGNHLYIAQAPLYRIKKGKITKYCWDKKELELAKKELGENCDITRFKGLGEMNAEELAETTIKKENRKLIRVDILDAIKCDKIMSVLMGSDIVSRKEHISGNINIGKFTNKEDHV